MMKGLLLLLIATFNTNRMGCKYLLVQLEDASDEGIKATSGLAGTLVGTAGLAAIVAAGGDAAIPLLPIAATAHHLANVLRPGKHNFRKSYLLNSIRYILKSSILVYQHIASYNLFQDVDHHAEQAVPRARDVGCSKIGAI